MKKSYKVLTVFHLIPEFIEFCIPELKSLMSLYGVPPHELFNMDISKINPTLSRKDFPYFPYVYIDVPDLSICEKVLKRSTLITAFLEAISEGNNYEEVFNNIDLEKMKCWLDAERFAFFVDTHQNKISEPEKIQIIKKFEWLNFKGKVDLKNPDHKFWVIEDYEDNKTGKLIKMFFAREIIKRPKGGRKFHGKFTLNNRPFLGPTTTDNNLAFLMANQAQISPGQLVYDPFVGTGGLMIPASYFEAYCFGSELDKRVVQGYAIGQPNRKFKEQNVENLPKFNIFTNFKEYSLQMPDIICMDVAKDCFKLKEFFDSIICDPPYGLRAAILTSEKKEESKGEKNCDDMVDHLFDLADKILKKRGRLVYLYPIEKEKGYNLEELPKRENFKLLECSENYLNSKAGRLLLTYIKI